MATPENTFRASVHKYKSKSVYQHKENNQFRGGIPDDYYESNGKPGILRVEYKFVHKFPKTLNLLSKTTKPALSTLQQEWLDRCLANGHQVAVIVGTDTGGLILVNWRWVDPIPREWFEKHVKSRKEVMQWIEHQVTRHAPTIYNSGSDPTIEGSHPRFK